MDHTYTNRHKDDQSEEDAIYSYGEMLDKNVLCNSDPKAHTLFQGRKLKRKTLILKLIQSGSCENWFQELLLRQPHGIEIKIPKQLVSLDDIYLRRCLEHMHMNAMRGDPCALSVNLGPLDLGFLSDFQTVDRNSVDMASCAIDYPISLGIVDLNLSPRDEEIVGSIMGSKSMMRILRSPLFQRHGGANLVENKKGFSSDYQGSPARVTSNPCKVGNESLVLRNLRYGSDNAQRSPISLSSGISLLPDESYASSHIPSGSQGLLHFTWDCEIPHFTFTLDDQKEVYVANAWKVKVTDDKAVDYVYSFHLKETGTNLFDVYENEPDLIGKMKVSAAFSLSSNSRIMETEFVLVGANEDHAREMHSLSRNNRRSRKLSKVMDVFKASHTLKQRSTSLVGPTAIPEDFSSKRGSDSYFNLDLESKPDLSEYEFHPTFELAAIVVKDHRNDEEHQKEVGGWGLKFLKKAKTMQQVGLSDTYAPSESCLRNIGDCSTSMDIIVPAGPHGRPNMRNEGPSSLIDRWRSGGNCDCGGWDIGCPLRILKAKPKGEVCWPSSEAQGDHKSFDMLTEGSVNGTPPLKMVTIRDGLYFISYQPSSLSALQCFAIAVAIIHSQCQSLPQKTCGRSMM